RHDLAVQLAKAGRRAELRDRVAEMLADQRQAPHVGTADGGLPVSGIEVVGPELEQRMGALVVRGELIEPEWPAAVRHPAALFQVPRVQRAAPAAPEIAAATEKTAAAVIGDGIGKPDVLAAIEVARLVVGLVAATLQQAGIDAKPLHLKRQRDAGH